MNKKYYRKYLIFITIILFVGVIVSPGIFGNINNKYFINFNKKENFEFVSGEFIVKFDFDKDIDTSKNSIDRISIGIQSIDVLNEKYNVKVVERLFNSCEKPYLYNIFKFIVPENSDILSIVKQYSLDPNAHIHIFYLNSFNFSIAFVLSGLSSRDFS